MKAVWTSSKRILALLMAAIMVCSMAACGNKAQETTPASTENTEMLYLEEPTPVPEGDKLITPLGELEFPGELAGRIRVEYPDEGELFVAHVFGSVGQQEAYLFTVFMGQTDIGYYFGKAPNAEGQMLDIRIEIEDFESDGTWSENGVEEVRGMQSRVNDLIAQIYELPGFEPA